MKFETLQVESFPMSQAAPTSREVATVGCNFKKFCTYTCP
jgi:hypothetical protein